MEVTPHLDLVTDAVRGAYRAMRSIRHTATVAQVYLAVHPFIGDFLWRAADGNLPRPKRIQARCASECVNPGMHSLALRACIGKKLSAARLWSSLRSSPSASLTVFHLPQARVRAQLA